LIIANTLNLANLLKDFSIFANLGTKCNYLLFFNHECFAIFSFCHFAAKIWRMPQKIRNFADVKGKE
jgi:hypothetical protein